MGIEKGVDVVVCGHIHQPCIEMFESEERVIIYMNSGDWIENLTALEFVKAEDGRFLQVWRMSEDQVSG